jgi:hypothetical protein
MAVNQYHATETWPATSETETLRRRRTSRRFGLPPSSRDLPYFPRCFQVAEVEGRGR